MMAAAARGQAPRYIVKTVTAPARRHGVWDTVAATWVTEDEMGWHGATVHAGVPLWIREQGATTAADALNRAYERSKR